MTTEELPPDLDDEPVSPLREAGNQRGDYQGDIPPHGCEEEPELSDPPGAELGAAIGFDNEDERAVMRPMDGDYQYGPGASYSGYNDDYTDPYRSLGGLTRPDAYFGAIEFDCPTCEAKAKSLDDDGEKCRIWIERIERHVVRKMPCVARIRLAHEAGIL